MNNYKPTLFLLLALPFLVLNCYKKEGCQATQADWNPSYLYNDGMAPEGVALEAENRVADEYIWTLDGKTADSFLDTVIFETSGDFSVSLKTIEGEEDCEATNTISIKNYPYKTTDRALSFFESNGTAVRLVTKVIDFPDAQNYHAISYSNGFPEVGGGMDYDNEEKKLFAATPSSLFNCFPNSADFKTGISADSSDLVIFDTALDPGNGLAYISSSENGMLFIRSTEIYGTSGETEDVFSGALNTDFVYLSVDRDSSVIYWTKKEGDRIYKIKNGINQTLLVGGPFYDLDFDNNRKLLYYVEDQGSSKSIKSIDPISMQVRVDASSINGEVPFIFVDEETQELFWANNFYKEIWSKKIDFQVEDAKLRASCSGKIKGLAVGNFVAD